VLRLDFAWLLSLILSFRGGRLGWWWLRHEYVRADCLNAEHDVFLSVAKGLVPELFQSNTRTLRF